MANFQEQPFSENEERYFLAEILKRSNLSSLTLTNLIREAGVEPAWNEIALPNGRSVLSCQYAFRSLCQRVMPQQQHQQQQQQLYQPPAQPQYQAEAQRKSGKRPYSMGDATTPITRELQPRPPPLFPGMPPQNTQSPVIMSPVEPPRKKRGRPTKAEAEKRSAEAQAKGEIWPKPRNKNPKPRRTSEAADSGAAQGAGSISMDDSGGEAGPTRTRPSEDTTGNAPTAIMSPPVITRGSIQEIMRPAGQVQDEEMRDEGGGGVGGGPIRSESSLPFYSQSQSIIPRTAAGPPRMPGGVGGSIQPFSPQLTNNPYQPGGYQSPAGRQ